MEKMNGLSAFNHNSKICKYLTPIAVSILFFFVLGTVSGEPTSKSADFNRRDFLEKSVFADNEGSQQQKIKVTGKVTDSRGVSLPGVTVVVNGTANGTITDNDVYKNDVVPFAGQLNGLYNIITIGAAILLMIIAKKFAAKWIHAVCLCLGALTMFALTTFTDKATLPFCMAGVQVPDFFITRITSSSIPKPLVVSAVILSTVPFLVTINFAITVK